MYRSLRALLVVALFLVTGSAAAQSVADLSKKVEALEAEVAKLSAQSPTVSSSITDLTSRLAQLSEALETLKREQKAVPEAIGSIDELQQTVKTLRADLEDLRTRLGELESPVEAAPSEGGGGVTYDDGFRWSSPDGRYTLGLGGLMQFRAESRIAEDANGDLDDEGSTYKFRRSRFYISAGLGSVEVFMLADPRLDQPLLDYWGRVKVLTRESVELGIKFGQDRSAFTRSFITWSPGYVFMERPFAVDDMRYDRSPGLAVDAKLFGDRLYAFVGSTNADGPGAPNANKAGALFARVEGSVFGPRPAYSYGDVGRSEKPVLVIGAGFVHELTQLPASVAGVDVAERDVDGDGEIDDVRVISVTGDILFRYMGLELALEGIFRREDWGTIFDQADNAELGALFEFDDKRNYIGFYGDVSYAFKSFIVGGRFGHHRQTPLLLDGRTREAAPISKRLIEGSGVVRYLHGKRRVYGLQYTYLNNNNKDEPEVLNDEAHRLILEAQLKF
ncbi:MAG: hypothetical protein KJO07_18830 [Deltaproteobacteria bacterium]|nr:hypothetical protein [Deltaproteobacteria bacterium]